MIFQKILLITILIVTIMLLMSLLALIGCSLVVARSKKRPPTKEEWKIMD